MFHARAFSTVKESRMTWAPTGQKWLPRQTSTLEPIEAGFEVCGVELERPLSRHHLGERWMARDGAGAPALLYRIDRLAGARSSKAFRLAVEPLLALRHEHLLPVERFDPGRAGGRWLVSPYPGNAMGVMTLSDMMRQRDAGRLKWSEVLWAIEQTLGAVSAAHEAGYCHGRFRADEIALDRRGGVVVELYGVARRLRDLPAADVEARTEESRSVIELGYRLATGHEWVEGSSDCRRELRGIGGRLSRWFEAGLVAGEFISADEARYALLEAACGLGRNARRRSA